MSDLTLARRLARYACNLSIDALPETVIACVRRRFVDSLACILGAYGAKPVEAAIAVAAQVQQPAASVFGTDMRTTAELAAFANGIMVRFLDYNDGYMGLEPGHPSDSIPACLALAEAESAPGSELIVAIVIAYEIQMHLQDAASLNRCGWDHVNYINVAMAAAAARLMKLDEEQAEQAINIALSAHLALRQVRAGSLSDWKGCSAANAARNAIFAANLARHGMTGPAPVFEGDMGFFRQVTGEFTLDVERFGNGDNGDFAILRSLTKTFPTNGELHTAVWAALELREQIADLGAIEAIHIETSEFNRRVLADPEKWQPRTRETADHSLPYNVARALLDGDITLESYSPQRIADPRVSVLMSRTRVTEDPALTKLFPQHLANRVSVSLRALTREVISGPGSLETPMSDADFERKFRRMAAPHIDRGAQDRVLNYVSCLEKQIDFSELFTAMVARTSTLA
jgi:2-methylcitrate dehydratase